MFFSLKKIENYFLNKNKSNEEYQNYKKLKKHLKRYLYVVDDSKPTFQQPNISLPIWQLWLQGEKNAPELVKKCLNSVKKYCSGRPIHVLTESTIKDYISIPSYIQKKYEAGIIPNAHFADVVRVLLLQKYGGTWIDATVLLTGPLPPYIENSEHFAFSAQQKSWRFEFFLFSNWFIHAQPNDLLIKNTALMLCEYWKNEEKLLDYFFFHVIQKILVEHNKKIHGIWKRTPKISNVPPHILQGKFLHPFDADVFKQIITDSNVHKLTYINDIPQNSFLEYLMKNHK